jgi:hypothetical protein
MDREAAALKRIDAALDRMVTLLEAYRRENDALRAEIRAELSKSTERGE